MEQDYKALLQSEGATLDIDLLEHTAPIRGWRIRCVFCDVCGSQECSSARQDFVMDQVKANCGGSVRLVEKISGNRFPHVLPQLLPVVSLSENTFQGWRRPS